ncbi:MAG: glycosyltransferase [Solirubrobacteraceae bacterium]
MGREILFYSDFPLGYHNVEAERKMALFAARGYRVTYVEQLGIRNPGPRHVVRQVRRAVSRPAPATGEWPFAVLSPRLLPPRRLALVDRFNEAWLSRRLLGALEDPGSAIAWVRYPTPELVPLVTSGRFALVVYEAVDDHAHGPGMTDRLRRHFRRAEAAILDRAGVVFAWSEPIRARLAAAHANVVMAPPAIDSAAFARAEARTTQDRVAGYAGALDFRFDADLVADVAERLADWRFDLAGPAEADVRERLAPLANVRLLGRLDPALVPALMASARVCLMPYRRDAFNDNLFPIKLVEYLAAGRPVASAPIRAVGAFDGVVEVGAGAAAFAAAIERAAERDSPDDRRRRIERVQGFDWTRRIDEMDHAIREALGDG